MRWQQQMRVKLKQIQRSTLLAARVQADFLCSALAFRHIPTNGYLVGHRH